MKRKSEVVSLFGEIEVMVARHMMQEGKGITILAPTASVALDDIPQSTRVNEFGERVRLVVVVPSNVMQEFELRIANLRA